MLEQREMAHLLKTDKCATCNEVISGRKYHIHHPALCAFFHRDGADQALKDDRLKLAAGIIQTTVGGGVLAVGAGRLAIVGKIGNLTGKAIGGALAGVGVVASVYEIVDAATEEAPPLAPCKSCGRPEVEHPGCILICRRCNVECNSWRDADSGHYCYEVCARCYNLEVCMKCMVRKATRRMHSSATKIKVHNSLTTVLYGTCKAARITGSSLTIAGTAVAFIPVVGWIAGPALIAGGVGTSIGAGIAAEPVVKVKCGCCAKEDEQEAFFGSEDGCQEWCTACGVRSSDRSKYCLVLCDTCEQEQSLGEQRFEDGPVEENKPNNEPEREEPPKEDELNGDILPNEDKLEDELKPEESKDVLPDEDKLEDELKPEESKDALPDEDRLEDELKPEESKDVLPDEDRLEDELKPEELKDVLPDEDRLEDELKPEESKDVLPDEDRLEDELKPEESKDVLPDEDRLDDELKPEESKGVLPDEDKLEDELKPEELKGVLPDKDKLEDELSSSKPEESKESWTASGENERMLLQSCEREESCSKDESNCPRPCCCKHCDCCQGCFSCCAVQDRKCCLVQ